MVTGPVGVGTSTQHRVGERDRQLEPEVVPLPPEQTMRPDLEFQPIAGRGPPPSPECGRML